MSETPANPIIEAPTVECDLPIEVLPKQGDRARVVLTSAGRSFVQHYQPAAVVKNARAIAFLAGRHRPPAPFDGPLWIELDFYFPWLRSHSGRVRGLAPLPKDTKPDLDNLAKQVLDALATVGWFTNDSRIQFLTLSKWYRDQAGVRIRMGRCASPA